MILCRFSRIASFSLALIAMVLLPMGCASEPDVRVTSLRQHQTFRQDFTQAYAAQSADGGTDVVFVDPAAQQVLQRQDMTAPVRQILHLRVMWSPTRDMRAVTSNAAIQWYVIGRSNPQDVLEYAGTAFVYLEPNSDGTVLVRIREANLKPLQNHGNLTDPVGPSKIQGAMVARKDAQAVTRLLSEVQTTLAQSHAAPTVAGLDVQPK